MQKPTRRQMLGGLLASLCGLVAALFKKPAPQPPKETVYSYEYHIPIPSGPVLRHTVYVYDAQDRLVSVQEIDDDFIGPQHFRYS